MIDAVLRLPCCQRKLKLEVGSAATIVVRRRCPVCRARWQVKVIPLKSDPEKGIHFHKLDWLCLEGGDPQRARYCGGAPTEGKRVKEKADAR